MTAKILERQRTDYQGTKWQGDEVVRNGRTAREVADEVTGCGVVEGVLTGEVDVG